MIYDPLKWGQITVLTPGLLHFAIFSKFSKKNTPKNTTKPETVLYNIICVGPTKLWLYAYRIIYYQGARGAYIRKTHD